MNELFSKIYIYCFIFTFIYQVYTIDGADVMCIIVPLSRAERNAKPNQSNSIKVEFRESRDDFMPNINKKFMSADFTIDVCYYAKFEKFEQKLRDILKTECGFPRAKIVGVSNLYKNETITIKYG